MYAMPLVVHRDRTIYLLEWLDRDGQLGQHLTDFADLVKTPEEIHTYKLSPYALWSAAAKNITADYILSLLELNSVNQIPYSLKQSIRRNITEFGTLKLYKESGFLYLVALRRDIIDRVSDDKNIAAMVQGQPNDVTLCFRVADRVQLKKMLFGLDLFVCDAANDLGDTVDINISSHTREGLSFALRPYQAEAAGLYLKHNAKVGGGGVIIMPPGAGKTLVGLKIIAELKKSVLIITKNPASADEWKKEILDKTDLAPENLSLFPRSGGAFMPVTISTYEQAVNIDEFYQGMSGLKWGIVIYDDAHHLPAETYERTAGIESQYKLALASTLARADGKGNLVYALIGPKWYEILPRTLERLGFQIPVTCYEIKVPLEGVDKEKYENERNWRKLRRIAAGNKRKKSILSHLLAAFWTKKVIIVSYYRNLAEEAGNEHQIPVIVKTVVSQYLQQLLDNFNQGKITRLIGTSAIEKLPLENCEIMIALSYQQGSKREEYLRLGKIIKNNRRVKRGFLYSLVSAKSIEEEDYSKRRRWLINYGYRYRILSAEELLEVDIADEAD